jgi:predicted transcriptional regulator
LKKLVTFRFELELLSRVKHAAEAENRTLTNFVETTLKRSLETEPFARSSAELSAMDRSRTWTADPEQDLEPSSD